MENGLKKEDVFLKLFLVFSVTLSVISLFLHRSGEWALDDHEWLWKECACVLKGIDPVTAIRQKLFFPDIGAMPEGTSTLPWTKVIGILVHGAFLPYRISCIYYIFLNLLLFIWMLYLVHRALLEKYDNKTVAFWGTINIFSSWYMVDWVQKGNNASIVCFLIICAICLMERHECMAGCLLGVAMIKPQIALPFYIVWLLMKKWKAIFISAGIVIASLIASVVITGVPPLKQLANVLNLRVEMQEGYLVYGIFDSLRRWGFDSKTVMGMSMLFGIIVCGYFSWKMMKRYPAGENVFVIYIIPALVSVFWCYKSQCDYNILMIAAIAFVEIWHVSDKSRGWLIGLAISEMALLMKPFSAVNYLLSCANIIERDTMMYMVNRLDLYLKTGVLFVWMFVLLKRAVLKKET